MKRSTQTLLVLTGAAVGTAVGTYVLLRRNREVVSRGAHRARQVSGGAERSRPSWAALARPWGRPSRSARRQRALNDRSARRCRGVPRSESRADAKRTQWRS